MIKVKIGYKCLNPMTNFNYSDEYSRKVASIHDIMTSVVIHLWVKKQEKK